MVETGSFCLWLMVLLPADPALAFEPSPQRREQGLRAPLLQGHTAPGQLPLWGVDMAKPLPETGLEWAEARNLLSEASG